MKRDIKEIFFKYLFLACAVSGTAAAGIIILYLFLKGLPGMFEIGVIKFIFGKKWLPDSNLFGILPMIVNTLYVTAFSAAIGVTAGIFSAVCLSQYSSGRIQAALKQVINLLAGIPSVVYGFFGITVLIPFIGGVTRSGGYGLLVSGIILAVMILPTIILISYNSLNSVPKSYYEGALALGATHNRAVFYTILPAASGGILAGVILGINRAIGETMAIVMVSGNVPKIAESFVKPIRTLTGNIVLEMGYASGLHMDALVASGVVLFVFVLIIITCFNIYTNKGGHEKKGKIRVLKPVAPINSGYIPKIRINRAPAFLLKILSFVFMIFTVLSLGLIIAFIMARGIPYINTGFLFGEYIINGRITIFPSIVTTLMLIFLTLVIAVPLGAGASVFLNEYTKKGSRFVRFLRSGIETLAGIPSIIFGLFGMLLFVITLKLGFSIYAGAFTLALMILPTIIRTSEESLRSVPDSYREGSFALGAGKTRTIFKVILPSSISGIITSIVLGMGRIVGESAPVLFTVGSTMGMPEGFGGSGISLAVFMYILAGEGFHANEAFAAAAVLVFIVIILNMLSSFFERLFKRKNKNAFIN